MGNKLSSEVRNLKSLKRTLGKADRKASDFGGKLEELKGAISDSFMGSKVELLLEAVEAFRDKRVENCSDDNINDASTAIDREIREIEIAIEAQERAAKAVEQGFHGGVGGGSR